MKPLKPILLLPLVMALMLLLNFLRQASLVENGLLAAAPAPAAVPQHTNRLAAEKSPYLLQHAHNPVDWYPWGEEAWARARKENKPIFLSIGYSTCHWCHVMAHESFENLEVAKVLNEYFVCIKVDREERPDVDRVYMTFVQALTSGGGWPMSVWLTPELKPFYGGTYYPPADFIKLLTQIANSWKTDREKILAQGNEIIIALQKHASNFESETNAVERSILQNGFTEIAKTFDSKQGGFGGPPKFPRPVTLNFLFRVMAREGKENDPGKRALEMNLFTLKKMAAGGIHDHLGGGFHRYSVDGFWHVPHFEKMLYDQAQLTVLYLDAFQITRDSLYEKAAREILEYIRRDMTDKSGGFYSAEDADSVIESGKPEHAEGAFYVWKKEELDNALGKTPAEIFNYCFGVEAKGNAPEGSDPRGEFRGKNILIQLHSVDDAARKFKLSAGEEEKILSESRQKLFNLRAKRPRPHLDDKIITAWNGLMISACARASQVLDEPAFLEAATRAASFLRDKLYRPDSRELIRSYRQTASDVRGFVDDYAFLIQGLLDLYEASLDTQWLKWANQLQEKQDALFWDAQSGGYFSVSGRDPNILLRMKDDYDGAEPSPNSVSALNLLRLAQMIGNRQFSQRAETILKLFSAKLREGPASLPQLLVALDFYLDKPRQIVLAGQRDAADTRAMLRIVNRQYMPNKILLLADGGAGQEFLANNLEFIRTARMMEGKATAYVCENFVCKLPTNDPAKLAELLASKRTVKP